jgi:putative methionine-R-sulfoxide reductase with GAF domain
MEMDGDVLYNENCKKAAKVIKMREKAKRDAGRHYLRHRETVLGKHRGAVSAASGAVQPHAALCAASVASSQKDTVDDSIQFSTYNGVISFD